MRTIERRTYWHLFVDILDLTQLDTLATEFDLTILSATVYDVNIRTKHREVTSPVETFTRDGSFVCSGWLRYP
jgi:hypothetical protein